MKNRLFIMSLFTICLVNVCFGQKNKKAQKEYDNLSYAKIIEQLSPLAKVGQDDTKTLLLANSYYFNGQMENASRWYNQLLSLNKDPLDKEIYFRYSQSLKAIENYSESDRIMKKFIKFYPEDSRSKLFNINYLQAIDLVSDKFPLLNLEINSSFSDFGTSIYNGNLIFSSSRNKKNKLYNWNNQPFLDLFQFDKEGNITEITGKVNTKHHESSAAFTKDGKTIYFTRNSSRKNDKNIIGLKIYKATFRDEKWRDIESLPFNSDDYNVAHPTLSVDETKLYFTSDMPGTIGGSDIFLVNINKDGTFGTLQNLGTKINTEGRENFPYVSDNGTLYFSSDSHLGLGGLDVFKFNSINNLSTSKEVATNIGKPINSPKDDFGYLINEASLNGYFTSNRVGGKGDDDIYSFTRN
ncbi:flagellar motor protein MotB, partial [Flavobacteriaceae bacterium]|nr:flagellar motor protein MotB [Flavobacteriaceae bacterium]